MRDRWRLVIAAVGAALLTSISAGPASAATAVLTSGGVDVAPGTALTGSGSASFGGGIKCPRSTITITVAANPPAPGVASGQVTAWTFGGCAGVKSITVGNLPYDVAFDDSTAPATVRITPGTGPIAWTFLFSTIFGNVSCIYAPQGGSITGTFSNSTLVFTNVSFTKTVGPAICASALAYSATYVFNPPLVVN